MCAIIAGCTDDPANADSKQIRRETSDALAMVSREADMETLQSAQSKVQSTIVSHRQADSEARDTARLASGNLIMARGRHLQNQLELKALSLRNSLNAFGETLRSAEDLLLEKERIEGILEQGQQETAQLQQFLNGTVEQPRLQQQINEVQNQLNQLQAQKQQEQEQQDKTQAVLDDYQVRADDLLRQAELANGNRKLQLQRQAYNLLQDRKPYYIQAQASEDQITALSDKIELMQAQVDHLQQSVMETQQRIDAIETSQTRKDLQNQLRGTEEALSRTQHQLDEENAATIVNALKAYKNEAESVSEVFQEAAGEFEQIRSRDAGFSASLQLAESYHKAAQAYSAAFLVQNDMAYRLDVLLSTADPTFTDSLNGELKAAMTIDTQQAQKVLDFYDQAIQAYQQAYETAGRMGDQIQCSVLKSQLLAVNDKMKLAEMLDMQDIAQQAQDRRQELIEKGQEFGVAFTQSETLKLVEYGIDYVPSLPVNLDVLAEQFIARFSAWKQLPLAQKEAAIEANLAEIEKLIEQYGESLAQKLKPLQQEMLEAQQQGFEESTSGTEPEVELDSYRDPNEF